MEATQVSMDRGMDLSRRMAQTDLCFRRHCGYNVGDGWAMLVRDPCQPKYDVTVMWPGLVAEGVEKVNASEKYLEGTDNTIMFGWLLGRKRQSNS